MSPVPHPPPLTDVSPSILERPYYLHKIRADTTTHVLIYCEVFINLTYKFHLLKTTYFNIDLFHLNFVFFSLRFVMEGYTVGDRLFTNVAKTFHYVNNVSLINWYCFYKCRYRILM